MFLEIKFEGGLGNQLFQYAMGRSLCIKFNIPYLILNSESYHQQSLGRTFALSNFQIIGTTIKNEQVKKMFRKRTKLNKIFTSFALHQNIEEKNFSLQDIQLKSSFLTSVNGYWQSDYYFNDIRKVLLKEFTPLNLPSFPGWISGNNTVAVHVRRSDYLDEKRYGFLGIAYYEAAFALLRSKIDNPLFIFCSDDIEWCKATFNNESFLFCEEEEWGTDYLQLYLMSKCTHQIIANSSFSWWGAWLNTNDKRIVVRPAQPFKDKSLLYESHYPADWISIEND